MKRKNSFSILNPSIALEIFTFINDLQIEITEDKKQATFGVLILRRSGESLKVITAAPTIFDSVVDAKHYLFLTLNAAYEESEATLLDPDLLTERKIEIIREKLLSTYTVNTWEIF
jgi:hypothetical protein